MSDEKVIKDAQYRKGLSIAFFNATNAAVEMVKLEDSVARFLFEKTKGKNGKVKKTKKVDDLHLKERIVEFRDWFLEEHKKYYADVIAQVGTSYNPEAAMERLKATIDLESLKSVWFSLSEDERHDAAIKKLVFDLKAQYEKA